MYRIVHAAVGSRDRKRDPVTGRRTRNSTLIRPPSKPRYTDLLARTRFSFSSASALWKMIPEPFKKTWQRHITDINMSPWNVFLSVNATRIREGEPAIPCPGSGLDLPPILCASSPAEGAIAIWSTDSRPVLMTVIAQKIKDGIGSSEVFTIHDLAYEQLLNIAGFAAGEYFVYCICTDAPILTMTSCSPSAAFKVAVR